MLNPFTPGDTVTVAVTTTSAREALAAGSGGQVMITCPPTGSLCFIEFGGSTVAAVAATSTPILPGAAYTFTIGPNDTHIAAIIGSGTSTIYATIGNGE